MEDYAADELDVEKLFSDDAPRRLADVGKGLRQQVVERFARRIAGLQLIRFRAQFLVRFFGVLGVERFNFIDNGLIFFNSWSLCVPNSFSIVFLNMSHPLLIRRAQKCRAVFQTLPSQGHPRKNTSLL